LSHGWLKVEEKKCSSLEEKEEVKVKSQTDSREDPSIPFIKQGEQVTLIGCDKSGGRRGVAHAQQV
jgi:hypothetical protein